MICSRRDRRSPAEVGAKSEFLDRGLSANAALYYPTRPAVTSSTSMLPPRSEPRQYRRTVQGRRDRADRRATNWLDLYANFGYTRRQESRHGGSDGGPATSSRLRSEYCQRRLPGPRPLGGGVNGVLRLTINDRPDLVGPDNLTSRDPCEPDRPARRRRGRPVVADRLSPRI